MSLLVFVLASAGVFAFIAWQHRSLPATDWQSAMFRLEETRECKKLARLLSQVARAGEPTARLHKFRLQVAERCPVSSTVHRGLKDDALNYRSIVELNRIVGKLGRLTNPWSLAGGWQHVLSFSVRNLDRPGLIGKRAAAWLYCSRKAILSRPIDQLAINLAVRKLNQEPPTPHELRIKKARAWCGNTMFDIGMALSSCAGQEACNKDRQEALNHAVRRFKSNDAELELALSYSDSVYDRVRRVKSISERHKLGRGYKILSRWYLDGELVVRSPAKAAYFATLALEKNQDTQPILDKAKSEMPESLIDEMERALAYYRKHDYPWIRTIPICNPPTSWRDSQGKLHPPRPLTDEERKRLPPGCIQRD